jgi:CRISPR-associated protein Csb2
MTGASPSLRHGIVAIYRVPEYLRQFTKTHAIITFSEPIVGPAVIGAGRYVGLGFCVTSSAGPHGDA